MTVSRTIAVLPDFPEEGWPSMDLCAEMLLRELPQLPGIAVTRLIPAYRHRLVKWPILGRKKAMRNFDRLLNRFHTFPKFVKSYATQFDHFHICDHTYAQIVHALPAARTGVYCHDLDAFRSLLEPHREPRPKWYRAMMRKTLTGLQKAHIVFFASRTVMRQATAFNLLDPARMVYAPNGVADEFTPAAVLAENYILHVGSCIARKRIDVLLDTFAQLANTFPELKLLQLGGTFTAEQLERIHALKLAGRVTQERNLPRERIADGYRRARLVLQPSEAEGFGLPVAEALACGASVLASDIEVFREVGGTAVMFAPVGDVTAWTATATALLNGSLPTSTPVERIAWASQFRWDRQAETIADAYRTRSG